MSSAEDNGSWADVRSYDVTGTGEHKSVFETVGLPRLRAVEINQRFQATQAFSPVNSLERPESGIRGVLRCPFGCFSQPEPHLSACFQLHPARWPSVELVHPCPVLRPLAPVATHALGGTRPPAASAGSQENPTGRNRWGLGGRIDRPPRTTSSAAGRQCPGPAGPERRGRR